MSIYIKSVLWFVGCGGIGYILYIGAQGSSNSQDLIKNYTTQQDDNRKRTAMDVLRLAATSNKPLHSMSKEEIERELSKK